LATHSLATHYYDYYYYYCYYYSYCYYCYYCYYYYVLLYSLLTRRSCGGTWGILSSSLPKISSTCKGLGLGLGLGLRLRLRLGLGFRVRVRVRVRDQLDRLVAVHAVVRPPLIITPCRLRRPCRIGLGQIVEIVRGGDETRARLLSLRVARLRLLPGLLPRLLRLAHRARAVRRHVARRR
jgi:hypothetical protein